MNKLFLSTPSARRATGRVHLRGLRHRYFYPRPPRGGRRRVRFPASHSRYFYPRPPRGGRPAATRPPPFRWRFLSTPSARRATSDCPERVRKRAEFLSTPSARRATRWRRGRSQHRTYFYPRPPRGGRHGYHGGGNRQRGISIHALREEGDRGCRGKRGKKGGFLSTPSARRATCVAASPSATSLFLSTPSARRATPQESPISLFLMISIHALREEGDGVGFDDAYYADIFLSTPSARRATPRLIVAGIAKIISIHALREEGDRSSSSHRSFLWNFYPRPPRGGRRYCGNAFQNKCKFLSTPSARRATRFRFGKCVLPLISIHALREEGDPQRLRSCATP